MSIPAQSQLLFLKKFRILAGQTKSAIQGKSPKEIFSQLWNDKRNRWFLILPAAFIAFTVLHWIYEEFTTESTDDAFISAHVHTVSSRVAGTVMAVLVNDNMFVKKGEVLIKLDPKDLEVQQKIADARSMKAHVILKKWGGGGLHPNESIQRDSDLADVQMADAALEQANLNLQYSEIHAAEDGKVGNRAIETGQQIQPGQALMALVEQKPWVVANFKEHQASKIHPGQKAVIQVDAIPGQEFSGHVDSVAPGSGATFSLLPPDNATGNFTKIVQRIPVKIIIDEASVKGYEDRLVAGMSVYVRIYH
ncbi:MAG: HlyD family secretion protein [Pseudobdellovibrionaceae bacterium]